MARKTNEQYAEEARCREVTDRERKTSDERYAMKIFEKIAYALLMTILTGLVVAWLRLMLK